MDECNFKLEREIMKAVESHASVSAEELARKMRISEKELEKTMNSMVDRGLISKRSQEDNIDMMVAHEILALKSGVAEFESYWKRNEPSIPIEDARKSDVVKYLFSYMRPQSSVADEEFYDGIESIIKHIRESNLGKSERESMIERITSKSRFSAKRTDSISSMMMRKMGGYETLDGNKWNMIEPVEGGGFVMEGPSPDAFSTFGIHRGYGPSKKKIHMRIDFGGETIKDFFYGRGGDCWTYALASNAMLRYFDVDTEFINFKPIIENPEPGKTYTHYANIVTLDGGTKVTFDPMHRGLNQTFPHKRKKYLHTNGTMEAIVRLAKEYKA